MGARHRPGPRGSDHLLGVVRCLLDWAVTCLLQEAFPQQANRHRVTADRIPFLFPSRPGLPPVGCCGRTARRPGSRQRGPTYQPSSPCATDWG